MALDRLGDERQCTVERFIADWLTQHRIPGAAVAIADGESVVAEGFGARTLEQNTPVTPETLFGVGSCTKPFTATAIMQLVETGALALDDAIDAYLPHLADAPGEPITVAGLLSHTSGMPSDDVAGPLMARRLGVGGEVPLSSDADFRRHVQGSTDRRVTDRDTFLYYNSGYLLLGKLIETVTGRSYATYLDEEVLAPLGMDRATFDSEAFEQDADRMTPYLKEEGAAAEAPLPFDPFIYPAGGLVSSVRELATFMPAVLGEGMVSDDDDAVLTSESVAAMTTPVGTMGEYFDGRDVGYGYGLMTVPYLDDRLVGHSGSIGVSNAWFGYLEEAGVGVALACTTTPETHPASAGEAVLALLRGEDPDAVQPHYRLMNALETAAGEYVGYRNVTHATVERVGGGLRLELGSDAGGQELLLTPTRVEQDWLVCTTTIGSGMQRAVRFEWDGETVELCYERYRLRAAT